MTHAAARPATPASTPPVPSATGRPTPGMVLRAKGRQLLSRRSTQHWRRLSASQQRDCAHRAKRMARTTRAAWEVTWAASEAAWDVYRATGNGQDYLAAKAALDAAEHAHISALAAIPGIPLWRVHANDWKPNHAFLYRWMYGHPAIQAIGVGWREWERTVRVPCTIITFLVEAANGPNAHLDMPRLGVAYRGGHVRPRSPGTGTAATAPSPAAPPAAAQRVLDNVITLP